MSDFHINSTASANMVARMRGEPEPYPEYVDPMRAMSHDHDEKDAKGEREGFEAYLRARKLPTERDDNGEYQWHDVREAWLVWQAARADAARIVAENAEIISIHDKLQAGRLGMHPLIAAMCQVAAGVGMDEAMRDIGYVVPRQVPDLPEHQTLSHAFNYSSIDNQLAITTGFKFDDEAYFCSFRLITINGTFYIEWCSLLSNVTLTRGGMEFEVEACNSGGNVVFYVRGKPTRKMKDNWIISGKVTKITEIDYAALSRRFN